MPSASIAAWELPTSRLDLYSMHRRKTTMKTVSGSLVAKLVRQASRMLAWAVVAAIGATTGACNLGLPTSASRDVGLARPMGLRAEAQESAVRSQAQVFEAACDIRASVEAFRATLGALNPNQPGSFGSGRREINWDAVPALFTNNDNFPADFFNQPTPGRARGAVFTTAGPGFRVSDNNFTDLNATYEDQFEFFSPVRTFIAVETNRSGVEFFVPGSTTPAATTGFGVVFSDIDHPGSGMVRLFDADGHSLGTYVAPACPGGLSFVGVIFPEPIVVRVEIVSGQSALGPGSFDVSSRTRGPARDLAIMDDFIYGEPVAREAGTPSAAVSR
jgi:hypothetical protein